VTMVVYALKIEPVLFARPHPPASGLEMWRGITVIPGASYDSYFTSLLVYNKLDEIPPNRILVERKL